MSSGDILKSIDSIEIKILDGSFESSVNSYGGKTPSAWTWGSPWFESSVNSYGGKTKVILPTAFT